MTKELIERLRAIKHYDAKNWYSDVETAHEAANALEQMQEQRDAFEGSFNAAIKRTEELEGDCEAWEKAAKNLQADNERLRGVLQEAWKPDCGCDVCERVREALAAAQESDDD